MWSGSSMSHDSKISWDTSWDMGQKCVKFDTVAPLGCILSAYWHPMRVTLTHRDTIKVDLGRGPTNLSRPEASHLAWMLNNALDTPAPPCNTPSTPQTETPPMPTDHTIAALCHAFAAGASDSAARAILDSIALEGRKSNASDFYGRGCRSGKSFAWREVVEHINGRGSAVPDDVRALIDAAIEECADDATGMAIVEACKHIEGKANDLYTGLQMRIDSALTNRAADTPAPDTNPPPSVVASAFELRLACDLESNLDGVPAAVVAEFDKSARAFAERRALAWLADRSNAPAAFGAAVATIEADVARRIADAIAGDTRHPLRPSWEAMLNRALAARDRSRTATPTTPEVGQVWCSAKTGRIGIMVRVGAFGHLYLSWLGTSERVEGKRAIEAGGLRYIGTIPTPAREDD